MKPSMHGLGIIASHSIPCLLIPEESITADLLYLDFSVGGSVHVALDKQIWMAGYATQHRSSKS